MEPTVNGADEHSHSPSPICSSAQGGCAFQCHLSNVSMHKLQKRQLLLLIGQTQVSSKPLADGMSFSLANWCPHMRVIRARHLPSLTSQMLAICGPHRAQAPWACPHLRLQSQQDSLLGGRFLCHRLDHRALASGPRTCVSGVRGRRVKEREGGELFSACSNGLKHQLLLCLI